MHQAFIRGAKLLKISVPIISWKIIQISCSTTFINCIAVHFALEVKTLMTLQQLFSKVVIKHDWSNKHAHVYLCVWITGWEHCHLTQVKNKFQLVINISILSAIWAVIIVTLVMFCYCLTVLLIYARQPFFKIIVLTNLACKQLLWLGLFTKKAASSWFQCTIFLPFEMTDRTVT